MNYSAPGKLFLFGEYAVLRGAPAIVTAVDRRVGVASTADDTYEVVGTDAPSLELPRAIEQVTARPVSGFKVDLTAMYAAEHKLGLGSSAASCVALTAAVLGTTVPEAVFPPAFDAHRVFQRGAGSGADVAAAAFGGAVVVRPGAPRPDVTRLTLHDDLCIYPVWMGESADTRAMIAAVNAADTAAELAALAELADLAPRVFDNGDVGATLDLVARYDEALGALGRAAGMDVCTAQHVELVRAVAALGAVAKPSGAGGGDVSLVFSDGPIDGDQLREVLPPRVRALDLCLGAPGLDSFF